MPVPWDKRCELGTRNLSEWKRVRRPDGAGFKCYCMVLIDPRKADDIRERVERE